LPILVDSKKYLQLPTYSARLKKSEYNILLDAYNNSHVENNSYILLSAAVADKSMAAKAARIPERVLDAPSQRLYVLSFALALQVRHI
jgi:hypothetical protein